MQKQLEFIVVKVCENLPYDITLPTFERNGSCQRHSDKCKYSRKKSADYLCYKKTRIYTRDLELKRV